MGKKKSESIENSSVILPMLALENTVVAPLIPQPLKIENEEQKEYIEMWKTGTSEIFLATTEPDSGDKSYEKIKHFGVICIVDRVLQMPGAPTLTFIRPMQRALFINTVLNPSFPMAKVVPLGNIIPPKRLSAENRAYLERVEELFKATMNYIGEPERTGADKLVAENSSNPLLYLYAIISVAPITWEEKYEALKCDNYKDLLVTVTQILDRAEQRIALQASIHEKTHQEINRQQKENFLRMHLNQVKQELGEAEENDDIAELLASAKSKKWSAETESHFNKELKKLNRLNINNPEYSVQYAYLEAFLELPWNAYNLQEIDLDTVKDVLDRDHYGLDKVKERIIEYMAVLKLRNDLKAPILCLYGPPGVGKTSIGKSVAEAVGREYKRIALGGMHDEAEIRGHRRTYIGAMPGRFLHALSKCEFGNPLVLLDEIDKVGKDYKGDPSSALLEALDPEQNNTFHDNFIDFPYDLSKVLFIATANDLSTIPAPLRDRMEIIKIPGYSQDEKREIAFRHLIDKALLENGFNKGDVKFSPEAIDAIIRIYTREKGVRQLAMRINRIIRKLAVKKVKGEKLPPEITLDLVNEYLEKNELSSTQLGYRI